MSDSLYTAFVEIRPELTGFDAQVRSQLGSIPAVQLPVTVDAESVGTSTTAAVEKSAPVIQAAGEKAGGKAGEGFALKFGERVKGTLETALGFGTAYAGFRGVEDFFKVGIDQGEAYARALSLVHDQFGTLTPDVQKASDASAHALGGTQATVLNATGQFAAVLEQLGKAPDQVAAIVPKLNEITGQLATRSSEDFATAQAQIQQFIETGQGRGLAKYLGRVSTTDIQDEARRLGLGTEQDKTTAVRDATVKLSDAQAHLNELQHSGNLTAFEKQKLSTNITLAQRSEESATANLSKAIAQHGRNSLEAFSAQTTLEASTQRVTDAQKALGDAQKPADKQALADATNAVADAQDALNKAQKDGALTLSDQERSLAIIQLLEDRSTQLPAAAPLATTRIKDDFADIARVSTESIAPTLDKLAGFLDDHSAEIADDIGKGFVLVGNTFQFIADHKQAFLDVAAAFGVFHEITAKDSLLNKLVGLPASVRGIAPGGPSVGTALRTAVMEVTADVVNIRGGLTAGGGGLPSLARTAESGAVTAGEDVAAVGGESAAVRYAAGLQAASTPAEVGILRAADGTILARTEAGITSLAPSAAETLAKDAAPGILGALGISTSALVSGAGFGALLAAPSLSGLLTGGDVDWKGAGEGLAVGFASAISLPLAASLAFAFDQGGVRTAVGSLIGDAFGDHVPTLGGTTTHDASGAAHTTHDATPPAIKLITVPTPPIIAAATTLGHASPDTEDAAIHTAAVSLATNVGSAADSSKDLATIIPGLTTTLGTVESLWDNAWSTEIQRMLGRAEGSWSSLFSNGVDPLTSKFQAVIPTIQGLVPKVPTVPAADHAGGGFPFLGGTIPQSSDMQKTLADLLSGKIAWSPEIAKLLGVSYSSSWGLPSIKLPDGRSIAAGTPQGSSDFGVAPGPANISVPSSGLPVGLTNTNVADRVPTFDAPGQRSGGFPFLGTTLQPSTDVAALQATASSLQESAAALQKLAAQPPITIINNISEGGAPATAADVQRGLHLAGAYDARRSIAPQAANSSSNSRALRTT